MRLKWFVMAAAIVVVTNGVALADDVSFNSATSDRENAKIKKLGKTALPVYSKTKGQVGRISMEGEKLVGSGAAAMYLPPLGWLVDSSLSLRERLLKK